MSERDEEHAMNMPRVSPEDVEPRVANTAHDQEVMDFKPYITDIIRVTSHDSYKLKSRYKTMVLVKRLFYPCLDSLLS